MDSDSDTSDAVNEDVMGILDGEDVVDILDGDDVVDILHVEDAGDVIHVNQEQNESSTTQKTGDEQDSSDEGDRDDEIVCSAGKVVEGDHDGDQSVAVWFRAEQGSSDDHRLTVTHDFGSGQGSSDVIVDNVHHLCKQPVPSIPSHGPSASNPVSSTSNPARPIGGTVSTNTAHATRNASGDQVSEILQALTRGGDNSYNTTVATKGGSQSDIKEVHVHLTQTNIHNPAAINLGGQVVVNPPKKMKTESQHRISEIQKLRKETERIFEEWTKDMVKTQATQAVLDKISQGRTWVTVTGSPGEGKTTAGYLVLKHLHSMGRNVYNIQTPGGYFKVKGTKEPIVMFNDIFGSSDFDKGEMKRWESVLCDILSVNEHRGEEMKEMKDKKPRITVILISRSSVLTAASHHLGRFKDLVLNKESVVDFTHGQGIAVEERMKI